MNRRRHREEAYIMKNNRDLGLLVCLWMSLLLPIQEAVPAQLPQTTQEILKKLKLEPDLLAGIDKELEVPRDWIEKAKREGKVRINATAPTEQATKLYGTFKERYPFIDIEHVDLSHEARVVKPLIAYKSGRIITDVLIAVGGMIYAYEEANALDDLQVIPGFRSVPSQAKDDKGLWVGIQRNYYCMAYNTKRIKKGELPNKWEDLLTIPVWRNGNLALANRPQLWALVLWKAKGEDWVKDFLTRLFAELKPQLRKEGITAGLELLAAGEFHGIVPAVAGFTYQKAMTGMPLGFFCPEPVPTTTNEAVILRGTSNIHAARIFLNWLLSKEGQIVQYFARDVTPIREDLDRPELIPFADQIIGKEASFRDPGLEVSVQPKLAEFWNSLWSKSGRKP
jgi:iron(III) transport system substrate-binding protein